mgnify:CR=1 FL=1
MTDEMPQGEWDTEDARETTVDAERCVMCKYPRDEWADKTVGVSVGADETLCSSCLKDLRMWKRARTFLLLIHDGFEGTDYEEVFDRHYANLMDDLRELSSDATDYGTTRSNATTGENA